MSTRPSFAGTHLDPHAASLQLGASSPDRHAPVVTIVVAASSPRTRASSGVRNALSRTTRAGEAPGTMRTVSCGSSARTVPTPTMTASHAARRACETRRSSSPLIHRESPVEVAMRPSSVWAYLTMTRGRSGRGRASPSRREHVARPARWNVAHALGLGRQVVGVAVVRRRRQRHDDVDDRSPRRAAHSTLRRVVRQQADGADAERLQDGRRAGVVAGVRRQPEQVVGVDGVGALVLGDVGAQLVEQTDASPLVAGGVDSTPRCSAAMMRRLWRNWTPQSQRSEPSASPVRHSECTRTSTLVPSADVAHDHAPGRRGPRVAPGHGRRTPRRASAGGRERRQRSRGEVFTHVGAAGKLRRWRRAVDAACGSSVHAGWRSARSVCPPLADGQVRGAHGVLRHQRRHRDAGVPWPARPRHGPRRDDRRPRRHVPLPVPLRVQLRRTCRGEPSPSSTSVSSSSPSTPTRTASSLDAAAVVPLGRPCDPRAGDVAADGRDGAADHARRRRTCSARRSSSSASASSAC